jgi:hypothetical protein
MSADLMMAVGAGALCLSSSDMLCCAVSREVEGVGEATKGDATAACCFSCARSPHPTPSRTAAADELGRTTTTEPGSDHGTHPRHHVNSPILNILVHPSPTIPHFLLQPRLAISRHSRSSSATRIAAWGHVEWREHDSRCSARRRVDDDELRLTRELRRIHWRSTSQVLHPPCPARTCANHPRSQLTSHPILPFDGLSNPSPPLPSLLVFSPAQ